MRLYIREFIECVISYIKAELLTKPSSPTIKLIGDGIIISKRQGNTKIVWTQVFVNLTTEPLRSSTVACLKGGLGAGPQPD